jgi:phosphate transport system substrate-binding protein
MPKLSLPLRPTVQGEVRRRIAMSGMAGAALSVFLGSSLSAPAGASVILRIGGTGMALATMRQLGAAFMAARPGVAFDVLPSLGTGGGLAAVAAGAIDLALSVRAINQAEQTKGLQCLPYARTPIAFVTHPGVGIHDTTLSEVARIFTGAMAIWPNGTAIRLVRREPSDADWTTLRAQSADLAQAVTAALARPGLLTVATDQENADALERLPGSFGAMSIGQMYAEGRRVVPLTLDGEAPQIEALATGRYRLSRTLHVVWRNQPAPDVADFLQTERASTILVRLGHIALAGTAA